MNSFEGAAECVLAQHPLLGQPPGHVALHHVGSVWQRQQQQQQRHRD